MKFNKAGRVTRCERNQYVHIAIMFKIVAKYGTEQCQLRDVTTSTEFSDGLLINSDCNGHVGTSGPIILHGDRISTPGPATCST